MRQDSRLPRVLHVLLHLQEMKEPATSETIGKMLDTNPALVRRTMWGLRERGFVTSQKGHGGGWTLAREPSEITLLGLYEALGMPTLFAIGPGQEEPKCLMEQAANMATRTALGVAEMAFRDALAKVTLQDLALDFQGRLAQVSTSDISSSFGNVSSTY